MQVPVGKERGAVGWGALLLVLALTCWCVQPVCAEDNPSGDTAPSKGPEVTPTPATQFEPVPDRWRIAQKAYPWYDPYNQNILKGDYPIWGQDIFLKLTGISRTSVDNFSAPVPSGASAAQPGSFGFFGNGNSVAFDQKFAIRGDLQKGSTAFKPFEWALTLEAAADINHLGVNENGVVSPDVVNGTSRTTGNVELQEGAIEIHLMDLSSRYDFVSLKVGRQPLNSDFRGLIFSDVNQGIRLFGSADGNRYQFNLAYFNQAEKGTNSGLNRFVLRDQQIVVANAYIQDSLFLGYQTEFSFIYDFDDGSKSGYTFDENGFLVRPDPVGVARPHNVEAYYLGWASEGHIDRINVSHAFYQALGHDTRSPIAGRAVDINGQLAFLELSLDQDWLRYQTSVFFTSGDDNPRGGQARGFDSILDNPRILGGEFSYWNRQSIRITDRGGVGLMQNDSFIPDLRSSHLEGQANFVNPGILIFNLGASAEVTQTLRAVANVNYIRFVDTQPLELLLKQPSIRNDVGVDMSLGFEFRPLLSNNIILKPFVAVFQPVAGFNDIFQANTLYQVGTDVVLVF
ncbi:MAG TPA: hypothetical protein VMW56_24595 [Candidatus Margulisiibacteriota bacterium]|nr:hypothetical protein [Candidatus Margulisiibacteriota bacterium]